MSSKTAKETWKVKSTILNIENIVFISLCILLFYPPFFRGLYFEKELLPTHIFSFTLALVWLISKFKDKEYNLVKTPIDIAAIGVVAMYFISIFYGVNTRLAIGEFLKYANYFFIFLMVRDLVYTEKRQKWLLNVLVISGVIVAVIGIGSAIGTWNYNGAYVGNRINSTLQYPNTLASYLGALFVITIGLITAHQNRIYKAIYGIFSNILLFTFILTYSRGMWLILPFILLLLIITIPNKRKLETLIYIFANIAISIPLAFLFSQKIGEKSYILWAVFIISSLLMGILTYIISFIDNKFREVSIKKLVIVLGIILIIFSSGVIYIINATTSLTLVNDTDKNNWTSIVRKVEKVQPNTEYELVIKYKGVNKSDKPYAGRVRVYSINSESKLEKLEFFNISDYTKEEVNILFTTLENTEGIKIFFDNYYAGTSITFYEAKVVDPKTKEIIKNIKLRYKYIPERIVSRFESISLKENSAQGRIAFYKDAFKIIKDYFILGTGGGGWVTLYQMYQSYMYWTTQAHNYFLQMWIEIGLIGLLIFISFICFITYYTYKKFKNEDTDNKKILTASLYVSILSIFAHAFMDFDLSLSALTFVLWTLIGMLVNGVKIDKVFNVKNRNKILKIVYIVGLIFLILSSSSLYMGYVYAQKALIANKDKNINNAIKYFEKASTFDPFKPEYKSDLATFYKVKYKITKDKNYITKAKIQIDKALQLAKYSSRFKAIGASFYMSIGQIEKGLELIEESIKLQPMRTENYLQKCDAYLTAFYYYANQKKDIDKAKEIIERAYKVKEQINEINKKALRPLQYNEDLLYKIGAIQFNYENLKNREYEISQNYVLNFAYYFDLDINGDGKIDMIRVWNSKKGNIKYEILEENDNNFIRITNDGKSYGIVYPYGLKLEPNTNYKIYFKARGNVKENTFKFFVYDNKAKEKNQGSLSNIKLNDDWQLFSLDIKTDADIKPGTQFLGFQHNGNDEGYIDLEEVILFRKIK
ncbi:O-antigen ligase family protein [Caloranaerobacter sp. DY30410]|uniref:O-antigen ligase family protein n=1 Tax=Caloranaerobacter sp. DY30410 TaxID=3238305 RepID=UPI003D077015